MTMSQIPARARRSICQTMRGLPATANNGLGVSSVNGRMRSPRPAALYPDLDPLGTLADEAGLKRLVTLLKGFRNLKVWHVQFNTVDTETLLAAQKNPEQYRDLVVRVAGYSALFVSLDKATQDDNGNDVSYLKPWSSLSLSPAPCN